MHAKPSRHAFRWFVRAGAFGFAAVAVLVTRAVASQDDESRSPTSQPAESNIVQRIDARTARESMTSGLIGSPHDFRQLNMGVRDLCLPCHTPHLAQPPVPRLDQRIPTTQPLQPYQRMGVELSGWSLLCLGCHDGITAQDVYSSHHAINVADDLENLRLGTPGLRSHPVGIVYPLAAEGYHTRTAVEAAGLPLPDGRIQCATCHDAHNTEGHAGLLRISNSRSRLCLTCHRI